MSWPERECPVCKRLTFTYRELMPYDDWIGAWDRRTETMHHHATGQLRICHHAGGDMGLNGWACSGSRAAVGPPLTRPTERTDR